ncbi:sensor histidine kinase [Amycolatopsis saalfeldensis]|uniref:histidine kinase n=1 Tax=Amycolatopsis saalfeldensis TaxID=394193 RepID=A0A1H8Y5X8_9PSEU|nr:histidine kinase [Amycolatopsis saalfeldensis]SEP47411.1 Signal transduction histidine kinase [Amycolatopsis saalfeldensis]
MPIFYDRRIAFVLAVVAVCVAATAWGEYASGTLVVTDLVLGAVGCALLPLLRTRPVAAAYVLAALALFAPTATPPLSVGLMTVANRRPLVVTAGVAAAGLAAHTLRWLWRPMPGLNFAWWVVLVVLGHAVLVASGQLARARRQLICSLQERAERAEAEQGRRVAEARAAERTNIAREMHDVLAHRLSLLATYAGALEYRPDAAPERLSQAAGVIRDTTHQALNELRDVITLLRDDEPDHPVPSLADLTALVEESRATGTPVEVTDTRADPGTLPGSTGRTVYRVVQEALTNARKHAPGRPVRIALEGSPGTRLEIEVRNPLADAGAPPVPGSGTGLVGLTERVRLAGGQLDHRATASEFRLHAKLPWPA